MFELMERNAAKYGWLRQASGEEPPAPIVVHSKRIPSDFVEHFRSGSCRSRDRSCGRCLAVATAAVEPDPGFAEAELPPELVEEVPLPLRRRAGLH
jgi:hypothetical protein